MKLRARTSVVGTLTASLAFALVGPAVAAHASSSTVSGAALARFPEFAGLTDSKSLEDPLMLQGKLTDTAGKALGGAQVLMSAWPSSEFVSKLPVGGSFDIIPMARTIAGKDGAYQLRSLLTPLLMGLTGKDGLDVELDVFHGSRHYVYLTQLQTTGGTWLHDFVRGVDGQAQDAMSKATNGLDLALDPATGQQLSKGIQASNRSRADRDRPPPWGGGCTNFTRIDDPKKPIKAWTTLATAVARNGTAIKTTYAKGAKTVTSTGFSFDKGATFSVSGARERSSNVEVYFRNQVSKPGSAITRAYEGKIQHHVLHRTCSGDRYGEYREQSVTSPAGLTGGFRVREDFSRAPVGCNRNYVEELGEVQKISTEDAKAYTYQRAFSFVPLGGGALTGGALSGYSDQVEVKFLFKSPNAAWCGHSGLPLSPGQIVEGYEA